MAIARNNINDEQASLIRNSLTLNYDNSYKFNYNTPDKPPIIFYQTVDGVVHIPYMIASSIFQIIPNININHAVRNFSFTGTLRVNQVSVLNEAINHLNSRGTTTLGLCCGFGKTIIAAEIASRYNLLTVVLMHQTSLASQWVKTFQNNTTAKIWMVGNKEPSEYDVIICMEKRWNKIPQNVRDQIGLMVIDEADVFCTPEKVQCLLSFHPRYIIIETATLERDDEMHNMMYAIVGTHGIYREPNKPLTVTKINTGIVPVRRKTYYGKLDWEHLLQTTLFNEERNNLIVEMVRMNSQRTILILTRRVNHATHLHELLTRVGIENDYMCGDRKNYTDYGVLIGTTDKLGVGFDPANLCQNYRGKPFDLLILASSVNQYRGMVQYVGRIDRSDYPHVLHLVDDDDIYRRHWTKAHKWYKNRKATVTTFNYKQPSKASNNYDDNVNIDNNIANVSNAWLRDKMLKLNK